MLRVLGAMNAPPRVRRRITSMALAMLVCAGQSTADPSAVAAPLASALSGEAKTAYERARALYENGDAAGAFANFERAHQASGDPRLLWNMAACAKAQQRYARAHGLVTDYLRAAGDTLTAEGRAEAEETRQALRALFCAVELRGAPVGAHVQVDGEEVGRAPLAGFTLDVGPHTLRIEMEDFETFTARVDVADATARAVEVKMAPRPSTGRLVVSAGSQDAIRVDGQHVKLGRWQGVVLAGGHTVDVTGAGKRPYRTSLEVAPRATRMLDVVLDAERSAPLWPWVAGGVALTAAAVAGSIVLFRPRTETNPLLEGGLGTTVLPAPPTGAP